MKTLQVIDSPVAMKAVEVGRQNKRRFRPLAYADELEEPIFYNNWWFIPVEQDNSIIPAEAKRRVDMLRAADIEVVDLIVAHETTKLLPAPPGERAEDKRRAKVERRKQQLESAGKIAALVGAGLVMIAVAIAMTFGLVVGHLLLIDPALIAVVEDEDGQKVWIEVATWYD